MSLRFGFDGNTTAPYLFSLVVATPDAMVDSSLRSPVANHHAKAANS